MDHDAARALMVERQLRGRGITDERVLFAMGTVPRERFVGSSSQLMAYNDFPLPIGFGQTISQPYLVALMSELARLSPDDKVLEVGAGSGYGAAVLSLLCRKVVTIEREKDLVASARERLQRLGFEKAHVVQGDGSEGYVYGAPFDAIIVTAAVEKVPKPYLDQVRLGGRIVIPLGGRAAQRLTVVYKVKEKDEVKVVEEPSVECRFVPLKGKYGM